MPRRCRAPTWELRNWCSKHWEQDTENQQITHRVISLGDSRFYYVTTAAQELGVVFSRSAEGHTMEPVSFEEVQCPVTKTREWRKVAKPTTTADEAPPAEVAAQPSGGQPT